MNDQTLELSWNRNQSEQPIEVALQHPNTQFPFILRNHSSDVPTYQQIFINNEYNFSVASSPKVIIDAGANIGLASIYFASKFKNATILAIEPEDSNFKLLQKNASPYKNIIPIQAALWHENGEIDIVDPGLGHWGFMTDKKDHKKSNLGIYKQKVTSITIDEIMNIYELSSIDIEGAEKEVFSDSSAWIGKVQALIVELHERMKKGCNRSFYNGSNGFDNEWYQGENIILTNNEYLTPI